MSPERLLSNFEQISDAPDAVPRLRRFILDLAVRGKLVEQDPADEPAAELLKRIEKEKKLLVKDGVIKESKRMLPVKHTDIPYEIPQGWKWTRLGESVNSHFGGGTPSKGNLNFWDGDIFWASVKDIGKTKYVDQTIDKITEAGLTNSSSNLIQPGNLIVVTRMGLGKVSINRVPIAINQDLRALSLSSLAAIDFYYIFFKTATYEGTGLTVKGIKVEELLNFPFPLPPFAEQRRIVAKVDELMALCNQLEAAQAKRETRRNRLVAATLHGLNNGDAGAASNVLLPFEESACFYFNHLQRLTASTEHIQQLRQTILNLAVQGKLVAQNKSDETASKFLKWLQKEKKRLSETGEIRQKIPFQMISEGEKPYQLPANWEWERLGNLAGDITSGSRGWAEYYSSTGPKFIRAQNIRFGTLELNTLACVDLPVAVEGKRTSVRKGDLLIVITGAGVTNPGMIDDEIGEAYVSQHVGLVRPVERTLSRWLLTTLMATVACRGELLENAYGSGKPGLNLGNIRMLKVPLPPITEQYRIVAKVDELMALCDELEAQLKQTSAHRRQLLDATLNEALCSNLC